ncbi:MAG: DUF3887 domain-containing protein, partial [Candidatus Aminicenantes bacterium]|nr:DUF3887 domain-containing protein [Candidatus Aminicenantes bacterium]
MNKKIFWFLLGVILVASFLSAGQEAPPRETEDDLIHKARAMLDALHRNDFEAAVSNFDTAMMNVFGPDKLAEFWNEVPDKMGVLKRQTAARRDKLGPYDIVLVTCEFEKVTLDARVVFDKAGKIAGFQFVPSLRPR